MPEWILQVNSDKKKIGNKKLKAHMWINCAIMVDVWVSQRILIKISYKDFYQLYFHLEIVHKDDQIFLTLFTSAEA